MLCHTLGSARSNAHALSTLHTLSLTVTRQVMNNASAHLARLAYTFFSPHTHSPYTHRQVYTLGPTADR